MYATSVGLLLKGLEYYKDMKEEMVIHEEEEVDPEIEEGLLGETEEEKPARKGLKKGKIFENLKNTLHDIFDESDVKM